MTQCPDCGQPLTRVPNAERLFKCSISGLYYPVSRRGELGDPMPEPPADRIQQAEAPSPPQSLMKETSLLPPNLYQELASKIGEAQIPNFVTFLRRELKMAPFRFMMQPKLLRDEVMARAFPHWLETSGLL